MGSSILQIILKVTKEGTGDKEAAAQAKELKNSLNDLGLGSLATTTALGAMSAAIGAATAFTVAAVNETVKYADEVRSMMQLTGQSAEESSRMIQVMDDLKVSTDVLTTATKTLSKDGLTMNMDTLAKLSDKYNQLGSSADKTAFLVKNFGKSGLAMAEAMEQGGAALKKMSSEVEGSLVLDQRAINSTREYQRQVDNLGDSWMAFQVKFGTIVVPALVQALDDLNNRSDKWFTAQTKGAEIMAGNADSARRMREAYGSLAAPLSTAAQGYQMMAEAAANSVPATNSAAEAEKAAAAAAKELSDSFKAQISVIGQMQSVEDTYAQNVRKNADERNQIEKEKADYIAQYGTWNVAKLQEFDAALATNAQNAQKNADEHDLASKKIILNMLEQQLAIDGLTKGEFDALLQQGQAWGIYSADVVAKAQAAQAEVRALADQIDNAPTDKNIDINVHFNYDGTDPQTQAGGYAYQYTHPNGHATGTSGWETVPAGYPNDSYPISLSSGEKFAVIPAGAGSMSMAGAAGGGALSMQLVIQTMLNTADQSQVEQALYPAFVSMMQRAKSDGLIG